jgi:serine O-acetyltransferase
MNDWREVKFWNVVRADLCRYGSGTSLGVFVKQYVTTPGFRYTFWLRVAKRLREKGVLWRPGYYLCRMILARVSMNYGISIPYNTRIGPGLYIGHHGGIVVNSDAVIGRDCNVSHDVTIGAKYGGKNPGVPLIGDRVYLGPGSRIIGGICLGNDVAVGANAVVLESVPDGGVVVGVPAKLISLKGSTEYVGNVSVERDCLKR